MDATTYAALSDIDLAFADVPSDRRISDLRESASRLIRINLTIGASRQGGYDGLRCIECSGTSETDSTPVAHRAGCKALAWLSEADAMEVQLSAYRAEWKLRG